MDREQQEEVFLDGLFYDIGKLVAGSLLQIDVAGTSRLGLHAQASATERPRTHLEAGRFVAQCWKLPPHACHVIEFHHEFNHTRPVQLHVASVHIADCLLNRKAVRLLPSAQIHERIEAAALVCLGLLQPQLLHLEQAVWSNLEEMTAQCVQLM